MTLTVLSVGYALAPVGPDAVGGSEQILARLDHGLVRNGHRSIVIGHQGSAAEGILVETPAPGPVLDEAARARALAGHRTAIAETLRRYPVDLIHMHGLDFPAILPPPGVPVLATLHLPPSWYPPTIFAEARPDTWLNCVSAAQQRACPPSPLLVGPVENGVPVEALGRPLARRRFALALGRICPEKGWHIALDAAKAADIPLLLAGQVFPYQAHLDYFRTEVAPRLDDRRRFLGPIGFAAKRRLLNAARCLLVPSLVAETSSLVAMEAMACGTPVVALPNGALPEIVADGRTGFLVADAAAMADAIGRVGQIDPDACRAEARHRFGAERMVAEYLALYGRLIAAAARREPVRVTA